MVQAVNLSRRNLLQGRAGPVAVPLRPPGAIPGIEFANKCTGCGECIAVCPQNIVYKGSGGYPEVDFRRGECTFCELCIDHCPEDALLRTAQPPWQLHLTVSERCLAKRQVVCQTCGDACEAQAIRFTLRAGSVATPRIAQKDCTGCGACIAACPENALLALAHG